MAVARTTPTLGLGVSPKINDLLDANTIAFSVDHHVLDRPAVPPFPIAAKRVIPERNAIAVLQAGAR